MAPFDAPAAAAAWRFGMSYMAAGLHMVWA